MNHDDSDMPLIAAYSRKDAIEDGVLVDVSSVAREQGFCCPVALTSAAWHTCLAVEDGDVVSDEQERIRHVLGVLRSAINFSQSERLVRFRVGFQHCKPMCQPVRLKALCGPGDDAEPVITVMLPEED